MLHTVGSHEMHRLASVVGALLGFVLGIVLVEVVFPNNASWPDVLPFALAVLGWLAGPSVLARFQPTAPKPTLPR